MKEKFTEKQIEFLEFKEKNYLIISAKDYGYKTMPLEERLKYILEKDKPNIIILRKYNEKENKKMLERMNKCYLKKNLQIKNYKI